MILIRLDRRLALQRNVNLNTVRLSGLPSGKYQPWNSWGTYRLDIKLIENNINHEEPLNVQNQFNVSGKLGFEDKLESLILIRGNISVFLFCLVQIGLSKSMQNYTKKLYIINYFFIYDNNVLESHFIKGYITLNKLLVY